MEYPFENKLYELDIKVVDDVENESDIFSELDDISTTGTTNMSTTFLLAGNLAVPNICSLMIARETVKILCLFMIRLN